MTTKDCSSLFLDEAMENLGSCFDYAVRFLGFDIDEFGTYFLRSNFDNYFYRLCPEYVLGISGSDSTERILDKCGISFTSKKYITDDSRTPEYWAGWIMMYYVNKKNISFKELLEYVSLSEIVSMYDPYHEMFEERFVEVLSSIVLRRRKRSRLQKIRMAVGMSQSQLSEVSGINIRTLQQYEIRSKDLSKASYSTVKALADALYVDPDSLIDTDL